jgi:hypothetical protein
MACEMKLRRFRLDRREVRAAFTEESPYDETSQDTRCIQLGVKQICTAPGPAQDECDAEPHIRNRFLVTTPG